MKNSTLRLTPLTTGRDNRSTLVILPEDTAVEVAHLAAAVPRPAVPLGQAGLGVSVRWLDCGLNEARHQATPLSPYEPRSGGAFLCRDYPQATESYWPVGLDVGHA